MLATTILDFIVAIPHMLTANQLIAIAGICFVLALFAALTSSPKVTR